MDTQTTTELLTASDDASLRRAFALALTAREGGNRPFGALLVAADGTVLAEGTNDALTTGDVTGHAEMNVIRQVMRLPIAERSGATMYASTEPCVMCSGALFLTGIRRLVFGFPESGVRELGGARPSIVNLPFGARFVLAARGLGVDVLGPHLEQEAGEPHRGFWSPAE